MQIKGLFYAGRVEKQKLLTQKLPPTPPSEFRVKFMIVASVDWP